MATTYFEEVKTYRVHQLCDECSGEMTPTGMVIDAYPAIYPHQCADCGHEANYADQYPRMEFHEAEKYPTCGGTGSVER